MIMLLPMIALAGQGGIPDWIQWVVTTAGLILAWFLKSPLIPSITNVLVKVIRILDSILESRNPDSPGGKEITPEEWREKIFPQLQSIGDLISPLIKK